MSQIGVEWYLNLPNDVGLSAKPLVSDGVLYFVGTMNIIPAVDTRSGREHISTKGMLAMSWIRRSRRCAPYLPASQLTLFKMKSGLAAVVRDGGRTDLGLPAFPDISDDQLSALIPHLSGVANSVDAETASENTR